MARTHIAVAFSAAFVALIVIFQLVLHPALPHHDLRRAVRDSYHDAHADSLGERQADGSSDYLIGVGKADITGYVGCSTTPAPQRL
jgi:hypothetical protein